MPTKGIWISYDLGVRGDYEGLYAWLDAHGAKECGDAVATLKYEYKKRLPDDLREELNSIIKTDNRTRIYLVYEDDASGSVKGAFIFGGRRAPAWSGYAFDKSETADEA